MARLGLTGFETLQDADFYELDVAKPNSEMVRGLWSGSPDAPRLLVKGQSDSDIGLEYWVNHV